MRNSSLYYDLDAAIYALTGNSSFTAEGLRSTAHLSKVAQLRVVRLRERRDALKAVQA